MNSNYTRANNKVGNNISGNTRNNTGLLGNIPRFNSIVTSGNNVISEFTEAVSNAGNNAMKAVANAGNKVGNAFNNASKTVTNTVVNTSNNIKNTTGNIASTVINTMPEPVQNTITNMGNSFKEVSMNISEPITESINAMPTNISPMISLPLILTLGILIIAFILLATFHQQIKEQLESIYNAIKKFFTKTIPSELPSIEPSSLIPEENIVEKVLPGKKQVFNVADNKYKYNDASPLCKALGAELATYEQVQEAWKKGADWCNYGWVKGQAAVYPTQKETWEKLQDGPDDQRLACGQIGINGGYFDNPELRFGVNCYGDKPPQSEHDEAMIMKRNDTPMTPDALVYDQKVAKYRSESDQIGVNPYKPGHWSD
jgi:hypothetical protein